ncbi:MAG TPA: ferredoxin family protein [Candidatus Bathyarchaeia archaeon]|nr:ferredoxin family protein [Candidatus Bathyarchaeia archaeon]
MGKRMKRIEVVKGPTALTMPLPLVISSIKPLMRRSAAESVSNNEPGVIPSPLPKATVSIVPELCKGCELCVYACPSGNLTLSSGLNSKGYHPAVFSYTGKRGSCTACGICYWVCPDMAISEIRRLKQ